MLIKNIIISMTLSAGVISVTSHATPLPSSDIKPKPNKTARIITSALPAAKEGMAYRAVIQAHDPEGESLQFSLIEGPKALHISQEGVLSFTPSFDSAGIHKVIIAVSDGLSLNQKTLTLTIFNSNRAPFFKRKALSNASENFPYNYPIQIHDKDKNDQLSLTLLEGPEGLTLKNKQLHWLPDFEAAGSYPVKLELTDQHGASAIQSFVLKVHNSNQLPVWMTQELPPAKEAQSYNTQLSALDPDGKKISYTLLSGPTGLELSESGQLSITPNYNQEGLHKVKLLAKDDVSATAITFKLYIENTNRAPIFNSTPPLNAAENKPYKYKVQWQDDDKDDVIIQLIESPKGMFEVVN